jgi:hypothetical protein
MTTNYGQNGSNPIESTTPIIGITQIGVTADKGFMNLCTNTDRDKAAIPVDRPEEGMWDIGMGDIIVSKNEELFRKMFKMMTQLSGDRTYGKALGIGQTGNLPVGEELLLDTYYKAALPAEQEQMRRQYVLRYIHFLGVSQDSWRKAQGPDKTADQDGLMVIIHGLVSILLYTERPLRPGALLVLDLIPTQTSSRAGTTRYLSQGPERYPPTLREHDPHSPAEWIKRDGREFIKRLKDVKSGGPKPGNSGTRMLNIVVNRGSATSLILEGQKNAALVVAGVAGIMARFLHRLVNDTTSPFHGNPAASGPLDGLKAALLKGMDTDVNAGGLPANVAQDIIVLLAESMFPADDSDIPKTGFDPKAATMMANSMELILFGVQDTAAVTNRIIGRNIQTLLPNYKKAATGVFTNDVFVRA